MDWPIQRLEIQRRFAPRFCPRRDCAAHRARPGERLRFARAGSYIRTDGRRVPRYRCPSCDRTFSKQTFALSYFAKRPELIEPVATAIVNGAAHRQIARTLGCAPSTVTRLAAKLGRHALLLQVLLLSSLRDHDEVTVLDHTESFEGSQDDPFAVATLVGSDSWFTYGLEGCSHARTGRRSPFQEARRLRRPTRDPRGGYRGSAARLIAVKARFGPRDRPVRIVCDDKPDYVQAARLPGLSDRVRLRIHPNPQRGPKGSPRTASARRRDAAMFPNDLLHGLVRHSLAHHHRETIAFPRRANAGLERLFLFVAWRNLVKGVSERKPDPTTPAMRTGVTSRPWSWARVLARRLFPDRLPVPPSWLEIYRREWTTPALPHNTRHDLRLAF
jgi:transposase-like protein